MATPEERGGETPAAPAGPSLDTSSFFDLGPAVSIPPHVQGPQRAEIERFVEMIRLYRTKAISEDEFRAFRLENGVYGIRFQKDIQMIRVKIPFGELRSEQLEAMAHCAESYGHGISHVTTRQCVQFHWVPLDSVPQLLADLADKGLTTREACGNTVRNVTACPESGFHSREPFDVNPYAAQFKDFFLRNVANQNLPRKFKVAFSGCPEDCAKTAMHDLGFRAALREEDDGTRPGAKRFRKGFKVYVGGGLGATPKSAKLLAEFLPAEELLTASLAVIRIYDRLGNRKQRHKARIKFLVEDLGIEEFRKLWESEFKVVRATTSGAPLPELGPEEPAPPRLPRPRPLEGAPAPGYQRWFTTNAKGQKQEGYYLAFVNLPAGDMDPKEARAIARLAREYGAGIVRTTIVQNVVIPWVPAASLPALHKELDKIGLGAAGVNGIGNVVGCPGADTCNLALTKSHTLARVLVDRLKEREDLVYADDLKDITIKVSGCPNSCGQHHIADIGFYGGSKTVNGKNVPYYQMLLGGAIGEGEVKFGKVVAKIPAKRVPEAIERVLALYRERRRESESFTEWVHREEATLVEGAMQGVPGAEAPEVSGS
jgi:sulfite reductase beta subunit-like hemoprotein